MVAFLSQSGNAYVAGDGSIGTVVFKIKDASTVENGTTVVKVSESNIAKVEYLNSAKVQTLYTINKTATQTIAVTDGVTPGLDSVVVYDGDKAVAAPGSDGGYAVTVDGTNRVTFYLRGLTASKKNYTDSTGFAVTSSVGTEDTDWTLGTKADGYQPITFAATAKAGAYTVTATNNGTSKTAVFRVTRDTKAKEIGFAHNTLTATIPLNSTDTTLALANETGVKVLDAFGDELNAAVVWEMKQGEALPDKVSMTQAGVITVRQGAPENASFVVTARYDDLTADVTVTLRSVQVQGVTVTGKTSSDTDLVYGTTKWSDLVTRVDVSQAKAVAADTTDISRLNTYEVEFTDLQGKVTSFAVENGALKGANGFVPAGTYSYQAYVTVSEPNYGRLAINSPVTGVVVAQKELGLSNLTAAPLSKAFDGTTGAPAGFAVTVKNGSLIGGDAVSFTGTYAYDDANVNSASGIVVSNPGLSGKDKDNYKLKDEPYQFDAKITKAKATLTPVAGNILLSSAALGGTNVSHNYSIPLTGVVTGLDLEKAGKVTWSFPKQDEDFTVGPAVSGTQITFTVAAAKSAWETASFQITAESDNYDITAPVAVEFTYMDKHDVSGDLSLTPAKTDTVQEFPYDGQPHGYTGRYKGGDASANFTYSYVSTDGKNYSSPEAPRDVGEYQLTATYDDNILESDGIGHLGTVSQAFRITAKELSAADLTAAPLTKEYDGTKDHPADFAVTVKNGSLIGGDAVTVKVTGAVYDSENVGANNRIALTATLDGAAKDNYKLAESVSFAAAITAKALTVKSGAITVETGGKRAYDGTTKVKLSSTAAAGDLFEGLIDADKAAPDRLSYELGEGVAASKDVGERAVTTSIALTGSAKDSYTLTQPTDLKVTIEKADRALTVENGAAIYTTTGTNTLKLYANSLPLTVKDATENISKASAEDRKLTLSVAADRDGVLSIERPSDGNYTVTARSNGSLTLTFTAAETKNYNKAEVKVSVTALPEPIESIAVKDSDGAAVEGLTATVDGDTIKVVGMGVKEGLKLALTYADSGLTPVSADADNNSRLNVKDGDKAIKSYMIDTSGIVKPETVGENVGVKLDEAKSELDKQKADKSITEEVMNAVGDTSNTKVEGITEAAASTLVEKVREAAGNATLDAQTETVEVEVTVTIAPKSYSNEKLVLDITPTYTIVQKDQSGDKVGETLGSGTLSGELNTRVLVQIKVPAEFRPKYAKHRHGNTVEYMAVTMKDNNVASWYQKSFSEVELLGTANSGYVKTGNGTAKELTVLDVGKNLSEILGKSSTSGWQYDGKTYTMVNDDLLAAINGSTIDNAAPLTVKPQQSANTNTNTPVATPTTPTRSYVSSGGSSSGTPSVNFNGLGSAGGGSSAATVTTTPVTHETAGFIDVADSAYYADAVKWAVDGGVTAGMGGNRFEPDGKCTRAQMVTFLWRAAGKPEPSADARSFPDVEPGVWYEKAVKWAVENGITNGTGEGFSPNGAVTRAETVTFLCRARKGAAGGGSSFVDVPADAWYAGAVDWAVNNGVTTGMGSGQFQPDANLTRAMAVTFLYRAYK